MSYVIVYILGELSIILLIWLGWKLITYLDDKEEGGE